MSDFPVFTPARVGRATEDVALQLEAAILSGAVSPGESLPSERELQHLFGTGRGVVREALKMLRQKGMLEVRKGSRGGTYVKQIDVASVSESLALFLRQNRVAPRHVVAFRESMDRTLVLLAAVEGSSEDKAALVRGARELVRLALEPETDMHHLGELDRELNLRFARMSGNPVFEWVMSALQLGFSSQDYALYEDQEFRERTAKNWLATAIALAEGDVMRCSALVAHHYLLLRDCVDAARDRACHRGEVLACAAVGDASVLEDSRMAERFADICDPPK